MSRRSGNSQSGYTQLLEGSNLVTARAVNIDVHHKHCYHIAKALRGMNAASAISYLEDVMDKREQFRMSEGPEEEGEEIPWLVTGKEKWDQESIQIRPQGSS